MTMQVPRIIVAEHHDDLRDAMIEDVVTLVGDAATVVGVTDGREALELARRVVDGGDQLPVVFAERTLPELSGAELALAMMDDDALVPTRFVLVTGATSLSNVDAALTRGAVHGMLTKPWSQFGLRDQLRAHLATYHLEYDPDGLERYGDLVGPTDRERARRRIDERRSAPGDIDDDRVHVLLEPLPGPDEVVRRLVHALDETLGHPPRLRVAAGSVLLEQGTDVGGIYVILDGEVELRRHTEAGHRTVHREGTGPIIGLLSLATQQRAFLEVRAVTEVRALPVALGQLARAVAAESDVGPLLTRTLVDALANRLREADELQVHIDLLNASLAGERDQLAEALAELELAQARLIQKERMATLGELAAGIAHELNNPTAALVRAAEHIEADVVALLADDTAVRHVQRARSAEPMSSADRRAARRSIEQQIGDRDLADRLVAAGITDPDQAARLATQPEAVERLGVAHELGTQLRNISTASARIGDLVDSLRAYLRGAGDRPPVDDVDITDTVEDALRLLGHRMSDITLERSYAPVPTARVRPGQLQQVWTNLVSNAIDSAGQGGRIEVSVDSPDPTHVRVRVIDDGPGFDPSLRDQLFEPHFTTKHGRISFGSGLGLSVCRQIVEAHHGTIDLDSDGAGGATATVVLPTDGTVPHGEGDTT